MECGGLLHVVVLDEFRFELTHVNPKCLQTYSLFVTIDINTLV